jgi:hypothetical protein
MRSALAVTVVVCLVQESIGAAITRVAVAQTSWNGSCTSCEKRAKVVRKLKSVRVWSKSAHQ